MATVPLNEFIETWFSARLLCNQFVLQQERSFGMPLRYEEIKSL